MLVDDVHFNGLDPVSTHTNEFRNVDGAVCSCGVAVQDGWAPVTKSLIQLVLR